MLESRANFRLTSDQCALSNARLNLEYVFREKRDEIVDEITHARDILN